MYNNTLENKRPLDEYEKNVPENKRDGVELKEDINDHDLTNLITMIIKGGADMCISEHKNNIVEIYERYIEALDEFYTLHRLLDEEDYILKVGDVTMYWVLIDAYNKKEKIHKIVSDEKNIDRLVADVKELLIKN
jgi:hypothetical protein